jgi:hypothetical protein
MPSGFRPVHLPYGYVPLTRGYRCLDRARPAERSWWIRATATRYGTDSCRPGAARLRLARQACNRAGLGPDGAGELVGSPASPATLSPAHVPGRAAVRAPARADTRPDGRLTASRQRGRRDVTPGTAALTPPLPGFPPAPCSVRGSQAVLACTKVSPFTGRRRLAAPSGLVSRIGEVIVMTWRWRTILRWVASVSAGVCPGRWPGRLAKWWVGRLDLPGHLPALTAPEPQVSGEM